MTYVEIDIEDYLDEVPADCLIKELKRRKRDGKLSKEDDKFVGSKDDWIEDWPEIKSVSDQQKQEFIKENWNNITLEKLESL
jgi:hypothetical protein